MDTGAKTNATQLVIFFAGLMLGVGGGYLQGAMKCRKECNAEIGKANREIEKANRKIMRQGKAKPRTVNPFGR